MFIINCLFFVFVIIHNLFGAYSDAFTLFSNRFNVRSDIIFEMYTKSNGSDKLTLSELDRENGRAARSILNRNFAFDYRRPTRIFIHGFLSKRDTLDMYLDAYLAAGDFNLIVVNWLKGAVTLSYSRARNRVKLVSGLLTNENPLFIIRKMARVSLILLLALLLLLSLLFYFLFAFNLHTVLFAHFYR